MIITKREETFYKIEMTADQARDLYLFFGAAQKRHIKEIIDMAGLTDKRQDDIQEVLAAFLTTLQGRDNENL